MTSITRGQPQPADEVSEGLQSWVVIPARLASVRLPGKMLLSETGKPLIQHTYEVAAAAKRPAGVCVACDCEEIRRAVEAFGGTVRMTDPNAQSGTDRVAEVARAMPQVDVFVNLQGDEPEMAPEAIDRLLELMERHPDAQVGTLAAPLRARELLDDPACVKVVRDAGGWALYFSRSPIPHPREWDDRLLRADPPVFLQHLGIYAYRREFLLRLSAWSPPDLERVEKLEQLRFLYHGTRIIVGLIDTPSFGIDTPEDYRRFVARCQARYNLP
ncbi:MAG: 3-deoxy-manno-octulosonate cytidylyltransferase [Thermogutta sp.]|nr:3-deoxy-manno-octulosonate cytidylyltransferase [Thermogutta sp.]